MGAFAGIMASAVLTGSAAAEDAPGPAFLGQLGSQLQPIRDDGKGDVALARETGLTVNDRAVIVDVPISGDLDAAVARLESIGMEVIATGDDPRPTVEGYLPLDAINDAARLGLTDAVLPVMGGGVDSDEGGTDVGAVTSLGVTRHNLPAAISAAGTSGAGVDVGVISDSMNKAAPGLAGSQASGDLPANTVILKDGVAPNISDEGRAMAEIIYDEAPGLNKIMFASGTAGPVSKADSINQLVANGADVIADDIFWVNEPFFQDGVVAKAADAARNQGIAYFASAGNRARQSYEGTYDHNAAAGLHDFDPTAGVDTRNCFSVSVPNTPPNNRFSIALGWDEPVGAVTTDLDLYIMPPAGSTPLAAATTNNLVSGDPKEIATYVNTTASAQPVCVSISRFAGARNPFLKWIEQDTFSPTPVPEIDTQSDTINPDAASAQGVMAVAAVNQADPGLNTPESFSSRGPSQRFFDAAGNRLATPLVLNKPQLAAADQVNTTIPMFAPFGGTSAAAPSAAGIATILRSLNPNASVKEIYDTMTDPANAIDCTSSPLVPDPDCGAGFVLADRAVANLDRDGAVISAVTTPRRPGGKNGWYTSKSVGVTWSVTDSRSDVVSTSGCDPASISDQGIVELPCNAVSGGGRSGATLTVRHDSKPPSKPKLKGLRKGGPLPPKKKIRCKAKDKTSGIASCKVKGYSSAPGKHRFKLTATDKAGLKSKATVKYAVGQAP